MPSKRYQLVLAGDDDPPVALGDDALRSEDLLRRVDRDAAAAAERRVALAIRRVGGEEPVVGRAAGATALLSAGTGDDEAAIAPGGDQIGADIGRDARGGRGRRLPARPERRIERAARVEASE